MSCFFVRSKICVRKRTTRSRNTTSTRDVNDHEHVTVKVRFLQECVQRKIILLAYIKTSKNIADIMTKQSAGPQFAQHRDYALGLIDAISAVFAAVAAILRRIRIRV